MAGEEQVIDWCPEQIPDEDLLFMRVNELWRRDGEVSPGAFKNHGDGMSTDWEKYSTPRETRARAKKPAKNAVVSLIASKVAEVPGQRVEHTPDIELHNRAHTDVFGEKDEEVRVKLRRIANTVIAFDTPVD